MTPEERWQTEGRVREELREAKRNLAAIRSDIESHAERLEQASGNLRHFLSNPIGPGPTGMTSLQYLLHFFENLVPARVQQRLEEFERESERLSKLEKRVHEFE